MYGTACRGGERASGASQYNDRASHLWHDGAGAGLTFFVLSLFPKLVAFLPKPGLWMESFKQGMGFLLMAAFVFLALVLGRQGGVDAIFILLVVILLSSIAAWVFGRWGAASRSMRSQWIARLLALLYLESLCFMVSGRSRRFP